MLRFLVLCAFTLLLSSCVSNKKYTELKQSYEQIQTEQDIKKALNKADEQEVEELAEELRQKEDQIANYERKVREMEIKREAGDMPEPTPEQLEAYTLLHEEQVRKLEQQGDADMETELDRVYSNTAYINHKLIQSIEAILKDYPESDVSYENTNGFTTVKLSEKMLFGEKGSSLSPRGEKALNKIIQAMSFQPSAYYTIYGVVDAWSTDKVETRSQQSEMVYAHMLKGAKYPPSYFAVSWCKDLIGGSNNDCKDIHIQFGFDRQHLFILLEETILD